jgi:hypothetical protein
MKFSVSVSPIKLARTIVSPIKLTFSVLGKSIVASLPYKKLVVAVGNFILLIRRQNTVRSTDVITFDSGKGLTDTPVVNELAAKATSKPITNNASLFDGEAYFAEDYIAEDYTLPIQLVKNVGKNLSNSFSVSDSSILTFTFGRQFFSTVAATDFLDGEVDKTDKSIEFFKSSDNVPKVSDQISFVTSYIRDFQNTTNFADIQNLTTNKVATNNASISDTSSFGIGMGRTDVSNVLEGAALLLGKSTSDSVSITDQVSVLLSGVYNETPSDSVDVSSSASIVLNKGLSETPTVGSSGSLLMQDYTEDMTYFAEDYVGQSRTF